jgi:hypothetical protein
MILGLVISLLTFPAALALAAYPANATETPIIFVSGSHDLTYARTACERLLSMDSDSAGAAECRSFPEPHYGLGRALEAKLISTLAVEPQCQGVRVLRDPDTHYESNPSDFAMLQANMVLKNKNPYWSLALDAEPGSKALGWTLFAHKAGSDSSIDAVINGEGTAEKAALQICIVVTGRGATVR